MKLLEIQRHSISAKVELAPFQVAAFLIPDYNSSWFNTLFNDTQWYSIIHWRWLNHSTDPLAIAGWDTDKDATTGCAYPIGSMYAIYGNIYHQYTPNVSIYTSTMDPMGIWTWQVTSPDRYQRGIFLFNTWQQYGDGRTRTRNGLLSEKLGFFPENGGFNEPVDGGLVDISPAVYGEGLYIDFKKGATPHLTSPHLFLRSSASCDCGHQWTRASRAPDAVGLSGARMQCTHGPEQSWKYAR